MREHAFLQSWRWGQVKEKFISNLQGEFGHSKVGQTPSVPYWNENDVFWVWTSIQYILRTKRTGQVIGQIYGQPRQSWIIWKNRSSKEAPSSDPNRSRSNYRIMGVPNSDEDKPDPNGRKIVRHLKTEMYCSITLGFS